MARARPRAGQRVVVERCSLPARARRLRRAHVDQLGLALGHLLDHHTGIFVVDIDHSPRHLLHPGNAAFYTEPGVRRLAERLRPGGVFTLWSNEPPDDDYLSVLDSVFGDVACEVVRFDNPLQGREATNSLYVAR